MHVNVIIEQSVINKINTAIYRFPDMETGGQLIGSIGKDAITGSYTVYVADLYHEISQVGTHPVRAEWGEPLCQQPDIKEGIAELEAEDMPICFVCSVVAIVAAL